MRSVTVICSESLDFNVSREKNRCQNQKSLFDFGVKKTNKNAIPRDAKERYMDL
jgi:hypothetical protein